MRVLVVGSGGREHAICAALKKSPGLSELFCAPGNGGISDIARCVDIKANDTDGIAAFCLENAVDFVVVAPDEPLSLGMVDALENAGIPAFGPTKAAAEIESSKVFSKGFMKKYGIPTAGYAEFDTAREASDYIRSKGAPIVVKADGLALGKGVTVALNVSDALDAIKYAMEDKVFGESGGRVVIEDYLTGPEVSVLLFTDGKTIKPMVSAQDHKRARDNDEGPNTGGMGAFAPSPKYTPEIASWCMENIYRPAVDGLAAEGKPFKGVLYAGLMLTSEGPKVIEFNARFGDPETQAVLSLLKSDLLDIFVAVRNGKLAQCPVEFTNGSAACVIIASGGYPGKYETGYKISGLENVENAAVYHAGTKKTDSAYFTSGGRVLGVTACGATLDDAIKTAYGEIGKISFQDAYYRSDIGRK